MSPRETTERLKRWEAANLDTELLADIRAARECIEGLCADLDRTLEADERQRQEDDELRWG